MTREEFDNLPKTQQDLLAVKALAWFCVQEMFLPYVGIMAGEEVEVIKIILGKYRA